MKSKADYFFTAQWNGSTWYLKIIIHPKTLKHTVYWFNDMSQVNFFTAKQADAIAKVLEERLSLMGGNKPSVQLKKVDPDYHDQFKS